MEGVAAEAIRGAEASLARQQSVTAQIDLQVVTAVLNAHCDHACGTGALEQLQQDVETAVVTRPDLDTPAGARSFQRYLIGKLRDIRAVVDAAGLDATSKAALSAALSSLYASTEEPDEPAGSPRLPPAPLDTVVTKPEPVAAEDVPQAASSAPPMPSAPGWGAPPPLPGSVPPMASWPPQTAPALPDPALPDPPSTDRAPSTGHALHHVRPDPALDPPAAEPGADVVLPSGETVTAPNPELAKVITAAVAGTPIAEAFASQGITIPAAGSPVSDPVDPRGLQAGDIGIFTDRHALALGNGQALLDNTVQPVSAIGGPGFIGWQHPPRPQ